MELEKLSDRELKNRFISLWQNIFEYECYSHPHDLIELELIAQELERRGYEITEVRKPRIRKTSKAKP
jgi:hypothetical protein